MKEKQSNGIGYPSHVKIRLCDVQYGLTGYPYKVKFQNYQGDWRLDSSWPNSYEAEWRFNYLTIENPNK